MSNDLKKNKPIRTAAYSRIPYSRGVEGKAEEMRAFLTELIKRHKDWENAGIYIETKADGTKEEKRPELDKVMEACREGKVDLVLVDSMRHFSRNTLDGVEILRIFSDLNVDLLFEKEGIHTDRIGMDFLVNMLDALSGNEVISRSAYMKRSIKRRFEEGTYKQSIPPYGYRWTKKGLEVVPKQAAVVRDVFAMVLEGKGAGTIRRELNERGVISPTGGKWSQSVLRHMISNPVYTGVMVYQKTYVDDQFRQRRNKGEYDKYVIRDHHEAIITEEAFENAQISVRQRAKECGRVDEAGAGRGGRRYCFTGKLRCAACGAVMHRHKLKGDDACWLCHTHVVTPAQCGMKPVSDTDLKNAFLNVLNKLTWADMHGEGRNFILWPFEESLDQKGEVYKALAELKDFLKKWEITDETEAFPEDAFRMMVDHCTVDTGIRVIFHFRCGIELEEPLSRTCMEGREE